MPEATFDLEPALKPELPRFLHVPGLRGLPVVHVHIARETIESLAVIEILPLSGPRVQGPHVSSQVVVNQTTDAPPDREVLAFLALTVARTRVRAPGNVPGQRERTDPVGEHQPVEEIRDKGFLSGETLGVFGMRQRPHRSGVAGPRGVRHCEHALCGRVRTLGEPFHVHWPAVRQQPQDMGLG